MFLVSVTLYARFKPFSTTAIPFVERNKVTQKPIMATNLPCEKIMASDKTVLIKLIACSGIKVARKRKIGVIIDL